MFAKKVEEKKLTTVQNVFVGYAIFYVGVMVAGTIYTTVARAKIKKEKEAAETLTKAKEFKA